jgi:alpha-tubulin suppressor-like RCC1 family protein
MGTNHRGQCGFSAFMGYTATYIQLESLTNVIDIACGESHTICLTGILRLTSNNLEHGEVYMFGASFGGSYDTCYHKPELALFEPTRLDFPAEVITILKIASSSTACLFLSGTYSIYTYPIDNNSLFMIGNRESTLFETPNQVPSRVFTPKDIIIDVKGSKKCLMALSKSGVVFQFSKTGIVLEMSHRVPIARIFADSSSATVFLKSKGNQLFTYGENHMGMCGVGHNRSVCDESPQIVEGITDIKDIFIDSSCAWILLDNPSFHRALLANTQTDLLIKFL